MMLTKGNVSPVIASVTVPTTFVFCPKLLMLNSIKTENNMLVILFKGLIGYVATLFLATLFEAIIPISYKMRIGKDTKT